MNDAERNELRAADRRLAAALRRVIDLNAARAIYPDPVDRDLFDAVLNDAWTEHRAASVRCDVLYGLTPRHADLRWRASRERFVELDDPIVLTASERTELNRLEADAATRHEQSRRESNEYFRRCREEIEQLEEVLQQQRNRPNDTEVL